MFRLLVIVTVLAVSTGSRLTEAAPNFLVFIADDQGFGDLSCYGHPTLKTPHIDRLAREGMQFERAFLTTSSCSPTRCSFLTGRYPHNTGAEDLHEPLPSSQKSLAAYLQPAGYHTMAVGKWHLGNDEKAHWNAIQECSGAETATKAIKLLQARPKDQPFFFWVASKDPHRPFDKFKPVRRTAEDEILPLYTAKDVVVPPYLPDHELIREDIADYYNEIVRFDHHVGEILDELAEQDVLDDTFIVYLSDNGMPFPRAKTTLYDSGIRTPLLIRYPPLVKAGRVQRELVSSIDVTATMLELVDIDAPTVQGQSLKNLLTDPEATGREAIFAEANWHDFEQFTRAVRTDRFLLIRNYYWQKPLWNSVDSVNSITWIGFQQALSQGELTPAQKFLLVEPRPFEELYDLQLDPHSLENVASDPQYTEHLNDLRIQLDNWRVETNDVMPEEPRRDGWTRDGRPLPHNQPWYDRYIKAGGENNFEKF
ncbi:sulfatase family protein [Thalassoroseus pseudoceratinae]|uniref:sulfatase family protein n=1 Tax=Thalassoroseus pseudoceratinae TaxID=2713176 RepID=UPI001421A4B5|nr:sulfatase [Thalassoroseus pseudoceratinae]